MPEDFPVERLLPLITSLARQRAGNRTALVLRGYPKQTGTSSKDGTFHLEEPTGLFNFSSVGGYKDVKQELLQTVDLLQNPSKYSQYGVRVCRGILLHGPPGTGKTRLAKALAGQANVSFVATAGTEYLERYVGVGAARIRELFAFAAQNKPCIVFIDEIDAIGRRRSGPDDTTGGERDSTLNQLLVCLDGYQTGDGVVILGATNRIDMLDSALIRAGRFDRHVCVPFPDAETRDEIIVIHTRNKPINATIQEISTLTSGFTGAQIESLLNEAILAALRAESLPVDLTTLEAIRDRMLLGQSTSKRVISPSMLRQVAVHEIGHLLVALRSKYHEKPVRVSVDPSPTSLGHTMFQHEDIDDGISLRQGLEDKIKVLLGGRVAEEVVYGESISSGASGDLRKAYEVARQMVASLAMGDCLVANPTSEKYKQIVDDEVHGLISMLYKETRRALDGNKALLLHLADHLVGRRVLKANEFMSLILEHTDRGVLKEGQALG